MLRCLLKMLVWGGGGGVGGVAGGAASRDSSRWWHIVYSPLSHSLPLHVSIEMNVARRPAVHPPLDVQPTPLRQSTTPPPLSQPALTTQRSLNLATTILCMTNLWRRRRRCRRHGKKNSICKGTTNLPDTWLGNTLLDWDTDKTSVWCLAQFKILAHFSSYC